MSALVGVSPAAAADSPDFGPLTSFYKGKQRVEGSGQVVLDRATYLKATVRLTDPLPDGNTVYAQVRFQFWEKCGAEAEPSWCGSRVESTKEIRNTTEDFEFRTTLHTGSSKVRALITVCAQMGWPVADSCSDTAFKTYDY
jgi:hypothetical protein